MLEYLLRAGDRVVMQMDNESRIWGRKGVPNGTLGTIAGRYRTSGYIQERFPVCKYRPSGIYSFDTCPIVIWDAYPDGVDPFNPEYSRVETTNLKPDESFVEKYTQRARIEWPVNNDDGSPNRAFDMSKQRDILNNIERTGDLPHTPLWELDIVSYDGRRYQIIKIEYNRWGPEKAHCYSMEEVSEKNEYLRNGSATVEPNDLVLIQRGNVWKELHNEVTSFHSLEEEFAFECGMGRSEEVRNPISDLYKWSLDEVLDAIESGTVDGFKNSTALFSDRRSIQALQFENHDLGERVRKLTLAGFNRALTA